MRKQPNPQPLKGSRPKPPSAPPDIKAIRSSCEISISMIDDLEEELTGKEADIVDAITKDINDQIEHSQKTLWNCMRSLDNARIVGGNILNVIRFWLMVSQDESFRDVTIHNDGRQSFRFICLKGNGRGVDVRRVKFVIYERYFHSKLLCWLRRIKYTETLPIFDEVMNKIKSYDKIGFI